jgi:formamidopyrimidine-DNA glycosylase
VPELPDILLYLHALRPRIVGHPVEAVRLASPFLLRSVQPSLTALVGRCIVDLHRLGKRVVIEAEGELFLVFHLMIAGRFRWFGDQAQATTIAKGAKAGAGRKPGTSAAKAPQTATDMAAAVSGSARPKIPGKVGLLAIDFDHGTLIMTEAGTQRRASLYVVQGRPALADHNPGGLEVLSASRAQFVEALRQESHTLKRALTDPHLFSGIGNAYSDEILHAARLSPFKLSRSLSEEECGRLYDATIATLRGWITRLQHETGEAFPEKVTAFREGMAVHGRYGQPCPDCGSPVQRVVYAQNEANYCATCQTGGRLLADRSLSRLLREDWPRTLDELERRKQG